MGEGHRPEFHVCTGGDSRVLGDYSFAERVLVESGDVPVRRIGIDKVVSAVCSFYGAHEEELRGGTRRSSRLRAMAACLALDTEGSTLTERVTGRDISTLSCAARKLQAQARNDARLSEERGLILETTRAQGCLNA